MRTNIKKTSNRLLADVVRIGRRTIQIFTEDERIDISHDEVADGVTVPPVGTELRKVVVSTNGDGTILYGMFPASGSHFVRFTGFSGKKGELPAPRIMPGGERRRKDGGKFYAPDRHVYTALLSIVTGDYAGCNIPHTMDYIFDKDVDGSVWMNGSKVAVERNRRFLELAGLDFATDNISYSTNVLPDLESLLLDRAEDCLFQVTMNGEGWVDTLSEVPAGLNVKMLMKASKTEDEDEDDDFPTRKAEVKTERKRITRELGYDDEDDEEEDRPKGRRVF